VADKEAGVAPYNASVVPWYASVVPWYASVVPWYASVAINNASAMWWEENLATKARRSGLFNCLLVE
jgi:hypothetical protein